MIRYLSDVEADVLNAIKTTENYESMKKQLGLDVMDPLSEEALAIGGAFTSLQEKGLIKPTDDGLFWRTRNYTKCPHCGGSGMLYD
jgi:hypothetical protein